MQWKRCILAVAATLLLTGCPEDASKKKTNPFAGAGDDQPVIISGGSALIIGLDPAGFTPDPPPWIYKYSIPPLPARVLQVTIKTPDANGDLTVLDSFDTLANFKMTVHHGANKRNVVITSDGSRANLTIAPTLDTGDTDKWRRPLDRLLRFRGKPIKLIELEGVHQTNLSLCKGTDPKYNCPIDISLEQPVIRICVADPANTMPCSAN